MGQRLRAEAALERSLLHFFSGQGSVCSTVFGEGF